MASLMRSIMKGDTMKFKTLIASVALTVFGKNEKGNAFWEKQGFGGRPDLIYRDKVLVDLLRIDT